MTLQTLLPTQLLAHGISAPLIDDGRKVIATAGTPEKLLPSSTLCNWVIIVALEGNTGTVVLGGASVIADAATRRGIPLNASDSVLLSIMDLSTLYLDVTSDGDGVSFLYGHR